MSTYFHYMIKNTEPLRISDASIAQDGQMSSLSYIPGSTIRGLVVNHLKSKENFDDLKRILLSDQVRFLNAYPVSNETDFDGNIKTTYLVPSPKGFYEDKKEVQGKKEIYNVVINGDFTEGMKRASMGQYCYPDGDTLNIYSIKKGSDLKIKINLTDNEKQNVFRNDYIAAGYYFSGAIEVQDVSLLDDIKTIFTNDLYLGNARSSGFGRCIVVSDLDQSIDEVAPYKMYASNSDLDKECYMMLLSDTVMRNGRTGELTGIDTTTLADSLNVSNLKIEFCSTSIVDIHGYNRTLGGSIPTAKMYQKGSVFKLRFDGTLTKEKMDSMMDSGIGIRRNEGFGRVIFFADYEKLSFKNEGNLQRNILKKAQRTADDDKVLLSIAKSYYVSTFKKKLTEHLINKPLDIGKISNSQLGILNSYLSQYRYDFATLIDSVRKYYEHARDKEQNAKIFKSKSDSSSIYRHVMKVLSASITEFEEILNIKFKDETGIMSISKNKVVDDDLLNNLKVNLLREEIRYYNKHKGGN